MEQPLEKGETVPTPMGKPRELPLGGLHGFVTNAARTALNPAPATQRPKQRKGPRTSAKRQRSRRSPTSWRSDRRQIQSNVPRSNRRESEPKPARQVLLCTS